MTCVDCIRCKTEPAVTDDGYCGHCHWAVRAEIEEGFFRLRAYLLAWAKFHDWCAMELVREAHRAPVRRRLD